MKLWTDDCKSSNEMKIEKKTHINFLKLDIDTKAICNPTRQTRILFLI